MIARTWPYGTRKTGTVMAVINRSPVINRSRCSVLLVRDGDDPKEAHILMDHAGHFDGLHEGQQVTIEFKAGGPTGGYWEVVR